MDVEEEDVQETLEETLDVKENKKGKVEVGGEGQGEEEEDGGEEEGGEGEGEEEEGGEGEGEEEEGGEGEGEEEDDEDEEEEEEEEEEGDEEIDDEDEEEDGDDDEEEDDDDEDEEEEDDEGAETSSSPMPFRYPAAAPDWNRLPLRERTFKIARFMKCTTEGCECSGMEPPSGADIRVIPREEVEAERGGYGDVDMGGEDGRTVEGWWKVCGACGHGWEDIGDEGGHVFPAGLSQTEKNRRGKVVGRMEELLQVGRRPSVELVERLLD